MRFPINDILLPGATLHGHADIVDYQIRRTNISGTYLVIFIVDLHLPHPLGAARREFPFMFSNVSSSKVLDKYLKERFIDG